MTRGALALALMVFAAVCGVTISPMIAAAWAAPGASAWGLACVSCVALAPMLVALGALGLALAAD